MDSVEMKGAVLFARDLFLKGSGYLFRCSFFLPAAGWGARSALLAGAYPRRLSCPGPIEATL